MDLSQSVIVWRAITLYGRVGLGRFTFATLEGWEDLPDPRQASELRAQDHGRFDAEVFSEARHVLVAGQCGTPAERDTMLAELKASFNFSAKTLLPLRITHAGQTLTADARLLRFKPIPIAWGAGFFGWVAEWVCPDPLRYGDLIAPAPVGFPQAGGGLRFPLFTNGSTVTGYLDFGPPGTTGRITLTNTGTADAWPQFTASGPTPVEGFDIVCVETGERLRFAAAVSAGSTLVLDSATGRVLLNGDADQSGFLTVAEWASIPPGASRTFMFLSRGVLTAASFTATIRPPSW
jgi:hypothetical protein